MAKRKCRVVWTEAATVDLVEIVSFVAQEAPANARQLLVRLRSKAESLERSPQRGRVVPELGVTGTRAWRELVVKPYRLVYRVRSGIVLVAAVIDGRRDLEDLLLERLTRNV
jgi:plasmid stabilization system protein ParE